MHVNHIVHRRSPMPDTQGVASLRHAAARQKQRGSKARLGYRVRLQIEYGRSFSGHPARRRHGVALQARCRTGSRRWNVLCCGIELLGNGIEVALHQAASSDRMASAAERNLRRPTALALTRAVHRHLGPSRRRSARSSSIRFSHMFSISSRIASSSADSFKLTVVHQFFTHRLCSGGCGYPPDLFRNERVGIGGPAR